MDKTIRVLSLFDGMSVGRLALEQLGYQVDYYASEIDKWAKKISKKNFPDITQVGDVEKLSYDDGFLFHKGMETLDRIEGEHLWETGDIDIVMGGSPCQGFSRSGNQLNFDDPRSKLFFEFVRLIEEVEPKYFLLENVKMKQEWQDIISDAMGVEPILINSSLVSAQNRERLYWTNIPNITQPEDRGLTVNDVLLDTHDYSNGAVRGRYHDEPAYDSEQGSSSSKSSQYYERRLDGKTNSLTTVQKDNILVDLDKLRLSEKAKAYMSRLRNGKPRWEHHTYPLDGKGACLTANMYKGVPYGVVKDFCRRLHPIECERLQTMPDNYTEGVSFTQRYKMLGNGWTLEVIKHILKGI